MRMLAARAPALALAPIVAIGLGLAVVTSATLGQSAARGPDQAGNQGASAAAQSDANRQVLNLKDADIETLVATVSEITGKNFIVDPRVKGKVTVISSQPLGADQLYRVFLSILRVHGYAAVPDGEAIKIVPDTSARQDSIETTTEPAGRPSDELVTRIIQVEHVKPSELIPILRPLIPQQGHLAAHDASDVLLISDRAGNVERLSGIVDRLDTGSDQEIELIRLENANATEVVRTLGELTDEGERSATKIVADERTNAILLGGDPAARLRLKALIDRLDTPLEAGGRTRVVALRYADAESLVPILQAIHGGEGQQQQQQGGGPRETPISIRAHSETNALVITAPPAVFEQMRQVIDQLDVRRAQVLVEAIIAEVAVDSLDQLGVQWQLGFDGDTIGGTNFGGPGNSILSISQNPAAIGSGLTIGSVDGTTTIPGIEGEILQIEALVQALRSDATTNVLSTPSVLTLDNQEAEIKVGQEVPFRTGQFTSTGTEDAQGRVNPFQTIQRKDVGLTLRVTPHINEDDSVSLEIETEVSSIAPGVQGAAGLITSKRTLKTGVMVKDQSLLVLGGLIDEDIQERIEKVPGLGDIPLLGRLFRHRRTDSVKRNLMVFLRPRIMRSPEEGQGVTQRRYERIRRNQERARQEATGAVPTEQMPLLPELEGYDGDAGSGRSDTREQGS